MCIFYGYMCKKNIRIYKTTQRYNEYIKPYIVLKYFKKNKKYKLSTE